MGRVLTFTGKPLADTNIVDLLTDTKQRTLIYMPTNRRPIYEPSASLTLVGINSTTVLNKSTLQTRNKRCCALIEPNTLYAYHINQEEQVISSHPIRAHLFLHAEHAAEKHIWEGTFQEAIDAFTNRGYQIY